MNIATLECPRCGASNSFYLSRNEDRHLRRCPDCNCWFVSREERADSGSRYRAESLDDPPTCPIDSCDETVRSEELPPHIIEQHDGTLSRP